MNLSTLSFPIHVHAREIICQTKFDLYGVRKLVDQNKEGQMSLTSTI